MYKNLKNVTKIGQNFLRCDKLGQNWTNFAITHIRCDKSRTNFVITHVRCDKYSS